MVVAIFLGYRVARHDAEPDLVRISMYTPPTSLGARSVTRVEKVQAVEFEAAVNVLDGDMTEACQILKRLPADAIPHQIVPRDTDRKQAEGDEE